MTPSPPLYYATSILVAFGAHDVWLSVETHPPDGPLAPVARVVCSPVVAASLHSQLEDGLHGWLTAHPLPPVVVTALTVVGKSQLDVHGDDILRWRYEEHLSLRVIGKRLGMDHETVRYWLRTRGYEGTVTEQNAEP